MKSAQRPSLKAVWQYPVDFDYLPVYRIAKVLHLPQSSPDGTSCRNSPCHVNQECHPLMNNKCIHVCLCKSNFTGENCVEEDRLCPESYCALNSLCKPNYRCLPQGNNSPYCICPANLYGDQCNIRHDICHDNYCWNNGTCLATSRPDLGWCLCTDRYYGSQCKHEKFHVVLSLHEHLRYSGAVVQYCDIDDTLLHLDLVHQRVYKRLPSNIEYRHALPTAPEVILVRLYSSHSDTQSTTYVLSFHRMAFTTTGTVALTEENRCLNVPSLPKSKHFLVDFRRAYD